MDMFVTQSCLNFPDYAVICAFLQSVGKELKFKCSTHRRLKEILEETTFCKLNPYFNRPILKLLMNYFSGQ